MKKCCIVLLALIGTVQGFSQGFYIRAGFGWAFAHAGQTMDGTATPWSGTSINSSIGKTDYLSYNIDRISLNSGPQASVGVGYMFTPHLGVDLAFTGALSTTEYSYTLKGESVGGIESDITIINKANNPLVLTPSLVLQSGCKVNVYSRMGLAVPLKTTVRQDQIITNVPGTGAVTETDFLLEFHNNFSLGLSAALGASYKTSSGIGIWIEASLLSLPVYTKDAEVVDFTINGMNYFTSYVQQGNPTTVLFSRNFNGEKGDYFNQPSYALPFSNIGINLGISFALGEQKSESKSNKKDHK
jgi:hypothetical protein